jgi:hypothetical protein
MNVLDLIDRMAGTGVIEITADPIGGSDDGTVYAVVVHNRDNRITVRDRNLGMAIGDAHEVWMCHIQDLDD